MLIGLKIEFIKGVKSLNDYNQFIVDKTCDCFWKDANQLLVVPKTPVPIDVSWDRYGMLISFDALRCLDLDGGREFMHKELKRLIKFLVKNKTYFFD